MALPEFIKKLLSRKPAPRRHWSWSEEAMAGARGAATPAALQTFLRHRDGYIREAALHRASETAWPEALPDVTVRINDWVPQVRAAGREAFRAYMAAGRFDEIVAALPEIFALRDCRRENHADFVDEVEQWLLRQEKSAGLTSMIPKAGPKLARALFDYCARRQLAPAENLIRLGLTSRDVVTARKACESIHSLPKDSRAPLIAWLLRGRSGWQRLAGLRLLHKDEPAAARNEAPKYLLDTYAPLREWCERFLNIPPADLRQLRRDALGDKSLPAARLAVAIRLCGNAKDTESEAIIFPYLRHRSALCRGAALLALSRIAPEKYEAAVRACVPNISRAVGNAAVLAMMETGFAVSSEIYSAYAGAVENWPAARRVLALASTRNKWDHLGLALALHAREECREQIPGELARWVAGFNRSGVFATPAQMSWIRKNLSRYAGSHPSAAELEFYLR